MKLRASLEPAIMMMVVFTALLGIAYPLATTGIAQVLFNDEADGSLIESDGKVVGSSLIGQSFIDADTQRVVAGYFRGRPSASNYDAMASGGSNLGPTNPQLVERVSELVAIVREENGLDANAQIPVDLVTASGSGLDRDISPASAALQVARVAQERGISADQVNELVRQATSQPTFGFLGAERVDVLKLNRLLDERYPDGGRMIEERPIAGVKRGALTIYLGAAPGVGKTVAMLLEGQRLRHEGRDVVVGLVETHGRADTAGAIGELEIVPRLHVKHRGVEIQEMDVDAILRRDPELALVDELAHTNAPGSPRAKRYLDVDLLLDAGIDVLTTLNVQHLESLNDVVASITGIRVRETLPDAVLDEASEIRLINLPPSQLRDRLSKGKIYPQAQADQALQRFFQTGNLTALREMALRRTAEGVDESLTAYMDEHGIEDVWPARERVVVVLDDLTAAGDLLRAAWRIASAMRGDLVALIPLDGDRPDAASAQLAEDLAAEIAPLRQNDAESIAQLARDERATLIVLRPAAALRPGLFKKSLVEELQHRLPGIDIYLPSW